MTNWIKSSNHLTSHGLEVLMKVHVILNNLKKSYPSIDFMLTGWCCINNEDGAYKPGWYYIAPEEYRLINEKIWEVTHWTLLPEKY